MDRRLLLFIVLLLCGCGEPKKGQNLGGLSGQQVSALSELTAAITDVRQAYRSQFKDLSINPRTARSRLMASQIASSQCILDATAEKNTYLEPWTAKRILKGNQCPVSVMENKNFSRDSSSANIDILESFALNGSDKGFERLSELSIIAVSGKIQVEGSRGTNRISGALDFDLTLKEQPVKARLDYEGTMNLGVQMGRMSILADFGSFQMSSEVNIHGSAREFLVQNQKVNEDEFMSALAGFNVREVLLLAKSLSENL